MGQNPNFRRVKSHVPGAKIPISHLISKIPLSNRVKSQNPNFSSWNPKIPNWLTGPYKRPIEIDTQATVSHETDE